MRKWSKRPAHALAAALFAGLATVTFAESPAATVWPTKGWAEATESTTFVRTKTAQAARDELYRYLFDSNIRTEGVVVVRGGEVQYERYSGGYDQRTPHLIWSIGKSVSSALIGIAERDGFLRRGDRAADYYEPLAKGTPAHREITIDHLLRFSSGIDWRETYEGILAVHLSSVVESLYGDSAVDMAKYVATRPVAFPPGTHFSYSSGDTNLLMGVHRAACLQKISEADYRAYPWQKLFEPLGMTSVTFEQDQSGTFVGSSYVFMTPRDLAKFGYLYLHEGTWEGQAILPADWVSYSRQVSKAYENSATKVAAGTELAGASWWLNHATAANGHKMPWPDLPPDTFMGLGHWGQLLVVIPSLDLVAVRLGTDLPGHGGEIDANRFGKLVIDSVTNPEETARVH